jgi:hypothetical protein
MNTTGHPVEDLFPVTALHEDTKQRIRACSASGAHLGIVAILSDEIYRQPHCDLSDLGFTTLLSYSGDDQHSAYWLLRSGTVLYLIVRGSATPGDWDENCRLNEDRIILRGGEVFITRGFFREAQWIFWDIHGIIAELEGCQVYLGGHSRGGALAQVLHALLEDRLVDTQLVFVSFSIAGPPALSDLPWDFGARSWVFKFENDIVPYLSAGILAGLFESPEGGIEPFEDLLTVSNTLSRDGTARRTCWARTVQRSPKF